MKLARAVLAAVGALLLCGAGEPPPPPPEIAAYIKDGRFEPEDHAWMRGAFADATPEQKALFDTATDWGARCRKARHEAALRELAELGIPAPALDEMPFECGVALRQFDYRRPYAEFEAALREARPIADTYIASARAAQTIALQNAASLGEALNARTMEEQLLRFGMSWGRGPIAGVPELSPDGLAMLRSLLGAATSRADTANTVWLKAQVAKDGWPKISEVGQKGSGAAWLLTQHADLDPVFQARALRLMEPLVAQGEVSKQNYAYLYDRIMLKLTGKQRYGTQWDQCEAGRRKLRPLEDEPRLADLRREMGLEPIEDYARAMDQMFGPCPAG